MKPFVQHDAAGNITQIGYADQAHIDELKAAGAGVVVGQGTMTAHYIDVATASVCRKRAPNLSITGAVPVGQPCRFTLPWNLQGAKVKVLAPDNSPSEFTFDGASFDVPTSMAGFYQVTVTHPSIFTGQVAFQAYEQLPDAA